MTARIIHYSLRKEGEAYLSPDFQAKEFACRDGSDEIVVSLRLVHTLQRIRDHFGKPVTIHSGYRTKAYNAKVGGAAASQHLVGTAADISIKGVAPSAVADYAETLLAGVGGIGRYGTFTHVDVRERKARWTG